MRKRKRCPLTAAHTDDEVMHTCEEVKGTGVEKRKRNEFYDFAAFEADMELRFPDWSADEVLEEWSRRCGSEKYQVIEQDGEIYLRAKGTILIVDSVDNNMAYERVAKQRRRLPLRTYRRSKLSLQHFSQSQSMLT